MERERSDTAARRAVGAWQSQAGMRERDETRFRPQRSEGGGDARRGAGRTATVHSHVRVAHLAFERLALSAPVNSSKINLHDSAEVDPKSYSLKIAVGGRFSEALDSFASTRLDYFVRGDVAGISSQFNIA